MTTTTEDRPIKGIIPDHCPGWCTTRCPAINHSGYYPLTDDLALPRNPQIAATP